MMINISIALLGASLIVPFELVRQMDDDDEVCVVVQNMILYKQQWLDMHMIIGIWGRSSWITTISAQQ